MKTITFKDGKCTSALIDKSVFNGMSNTIIHIVSDNPDDRVVCTAVCSYLSQIIGENIYPDGSLFDFRETSTLVEAYLQISFH